MRKILVLGGGFAGFHAALSAKLVAKDSARVSLLSRTAEIEIRPRLYEADPRAMTADLLRPLNLAGIEFVQGDANDIDLTRRAVTTVDGSVHAYDTVVIATGSVMPLPPIPGATLAYAIDTVETAAKFERRLKQAAFCNVPTIVVVGAGFVGLELVLELRARIASVAGQDQAQRAKLLLVDRANVVGLELGAGPRAVINAALKDADVELKLGCDIAEISADGVELSSGEYIAADAVILCTGLRAAPFVQKVPGSRDPLGRLRLDPYLQAPGAPGVFVAGDAGVADTAPNRPSLMACQHAVGMGRFAGANAARFLLGQTLLSYSQTRYVTCLDLGQSGAVLTEGWKREVVLTGEEAKAVKRQINTEWIYPPSGSREAVLAAGDPSLPVVA